MRKITLTFILCCLCLSLLAQITDRPVELRFFGEYAYNPTYEHFGNFDLQALIPLNRHFELDANLQASTANYYTAALNTRALFPLPVGELFFENRLLYKYIARSSVYDFDLALALGYRMDYVNVQIGCFSRFFDRLNGPWHSEEETVIEPFNLLYRVEVFVRPQTSPWNLSFGACNVDEYQMERMWQPIFTLAGRYNPMPRLSVLAGIESKPTGMFHLNAQFYALHARLGIAYRLR